MIYSIFGADWFRTKQYIDGLLKQYEAKQYRIIKVSTNDENWFETISQYAKQDSLFSEKLCVVLSIDPKETRSSQPVGGSGQESEGEEGTYNTQELKGQINKLIKAFLRGDHVFVIWNRARKLAFGTKMQRIQEQGFELLKGQVLVEWVQEYAKSCGTSISVALAQDLALACGSNTALIAHEIQKCELCYPGEKITKQHIQELCSYAPTMTYFDWMQDIFSGNWKTKALTAQLDEHDAAQRLAGLINALRIILVSRSQASVEKTGFMRNVNPYWLRSLTQWSRSVPEQKLEQWFTVLVQYDLWVRSGKIKEDEALEKFVFSIV